jgi:hypothetical protein
MRFVFSVKRTRCFVEEHVVRLVQQHGRERLCLAYPFGDALNLMYFPVDNPGGDICRERVLLQ